MADFLRDPNSLVTNSIEFTDAMKWVFTPHINVDAETRDGDELFESWQLLDYIINSIQDGISVLDTGLTIRYVNALMYHWYASAETLVGEKCYRAYHRRDMPCENCPVLQAMAHKTPFVGVAKYSPSGQHKGWQALFAIPILDGDDNVLGVLEHVRDVTSVFKMNDQLTTLLRRFERLEQENQAFASLLSQRKGEIEELEQTIATNMEKFVKPSLDILKRELACSDVELVEGLINEIVYPITKRRSSKLEQLTARELQVAALIKEGKTSKEIAHVLCITLKTVEYHRANIRKKLGLSGEEGRRANLRAYLIANL